MDSKYIKPNHREQTVLFALPQYNESNFPDVLLEKYSSDIEQQIQNCINQGKRYFVTFCKNQLEIEFSFLVIKYKKNYPDIKMIFASNISFRIRMEHDILQEVKKRSDEFDDILKMEDYSEEEFYKSLFECSSVLIGIYSKYDFTKRKFFKLAQQSNIDIVNLYKGKEIDIKMVLKNTNDIFYNSPVPTIDLITYSTKYQELILNMEELTSEIFTESSDTKQLIKKINQIDKIYNKLYQHVSAYYFLYGLKNQK